MPTILPRKLYLPCLLVAISVSIICSSAYADVLKPIENVKALGNKLGSKVLKPIKNANVFGNKFEEVVVGSVAPDFTLKSLSGESVRLSEQHGKTVLITFWASWCSPCRIELPHFQKLQQDLGKDKVSILAVSADSRLEDVSAFSKELSLTVPMLFDPGLDVNQLYRVRAMPTTFIVDSSGVIRHIHMGFKESVLPLYEKELRALIKE